MSRLDPRLFKADRPLAMGRFNTVGGHALTPGDPITIVDEPKERGEVTLDTATRLWAGGTFVYAEDARPTPVESPQDAANRLVEMEELDNGYFLIRAPWLGEGEKVHGREAAETRRDELIAAGQPVEVAGSTVTDEPLAGAGEGQRMPGDNGGAAPIKTVDERVAALAADKSEGGKTETELRDMIAAIDEKRAAMDPPLDPLGAKSDHNKTDLARLIVEADGDVEEAPTEG